MGMSVLEPIPATGDCSGEEAGELVGSAAAVVLASGATDTSASDTAGAGAGALARRFDFRFAGKELPVAECPRLGWSAGSAAIASAQPATPADDWPT